MYTEYSLKRDMSCVQAVLWNARSLQPMTELHGHGGVVLTADLSDCASTAFTGAGDGVRTLL